MEAYVANGDDLQEGTKTLVVGGVVDGSRGKQIKTETENRTD